MLRRALPAGRCRNRADRALQAVNLAHRVIGAEVRRGTFDVAVDGRRVGSAESHGTFETPVEAGHRTLQIRNGRNSSRTQASDADEGQVVAFRCSGKRVLPIFLVSFAVPSLAISLTRE